MVEFAFGADGTSVGAHDVLGDGEAEAGASGFAGARFVDAIETLEEARQMFGRDSSTVVADIEFDAPLRSTGAEFYASTSTSVFHCIVDQVREYLVDGFAIRENLRERFDRAAAVIRVYDPELDTLPASDLAEAFFSVV